MSRYGLDGRRAIITGAASGIGLATARRLRDEGCRVLAVDLQPTPLEGVEVLVQDVATPEAAAHIVAEAARRLGGLDILFNNAGVSAFMELEGHSDDLWDRNLAVNVTALFRLSRAAAPLLKQSPAGRIINTGSVMSSFGAAGMVAYAASKHAVLGVTKALAAELGPFGITVNAIQPGAILTGITGPTFEQMPEFRTYWENKAALRRIGRPEEIASVVAFLCSDDASFVSGHGILIDGGAVQQA